MWRGVETWLLSCVCVVVKRKEYRLSERFVVDVGRKDDVLA
jgi:hypothetical protein